MKISRRGFIPLAAAGVAGLGADAAGASAQGGGELEKVVFLSAASPATTSNGWSRSP